MYEYRCRDCGKSFEELLPRVTDTTLPCPVCRSANTEKLMSVVSAGKAKSESPSCGPSCPGASCCGGRSCAAGLGG